MTKKIAHPTRVFTMPVLSPAAARTLQLLQHVHVEPARIAAVVESDSVWAAELLREARSPMWGVNPAPGDAREALGLFGLRRFYQLVAVSAVGPLLRAPLPGYGLAAGELWEHSMAVAVATREIILEKGFKPCEEAFTAALLHDVGKLILGSALESMPRRSTGETREPGEDVERRVAGMDHAEAGAALLAHWKMPHWLVAAVRSHHAPLESSFLIADLVHLADSLCRSAGAASGRSGVSSDTSLRWNFSRRSLGHILARTQDTLAEVRELAAVGEGR